MDTNNSRTADGVLIEPGLKVWNNNLEVVTIVKPLYEECGVIWWATSDRGIFDGSRLSTVWQGKKA